MANEELSKLKVEIQKTKEDLKDLEIYIEEFSSFLPIAVCTVNPLKIIIDVNRTFQNLTGYSSIEIIGESLEKIFLEKKELNSLLAEAQKKRIIESREFILISSKKKEVPVSVSISIKKDKEDNFIGYFVGITDISQLKEFQTKLEKKVKEKTVELEEEKTVLEIKVEARTKELKELAEGLDEQVKERTKELQKRVNELEKFHRLTVGRELRIIELKKEIERLTKELKESKDMK